MFTGLQRQFQHRRPPCRPGIERCRSRCFRRACAPTRAHRRFPALRRRVRRGALSEDHLPLPPRCGEDRTVDRRHRGRAGSARQIAAAPTSAALQAKQGGSRISYSRHHGQICARPTAWASSTPIYSSAGEIRHDAERHPQLKRVAEKVRDALDITVRMSWSRNRCALSGHARQLPICAFPVDKSSPPIIGHVELPPHRGQLPCDRSPAALNSGTSNSTVAVIENSRPRLDAAGGRRGSDAAERDLLQLRGRRPPISDSQAIGRVRACGRGGGGRAMRALKACSAPRWQTKRKTAHPGAPDRLHRHHRAVPAPFEGQARRSRRPRKRRDGEAGAAGDAFRRPGRQGRRGCGTSWRRPRTGGLQARIAFQFEPIAAALDYERGGDARGTGADRRHGRRHVEDFSIVRVSPERATAVDRKDDILANRGIPASAARIFDRPSSASNTSCRISAI